MSYLLHIKKINKCGVFTAGEQEMFLPMPHTSYFILLC
jgi:hypothetical protein